VGLYVWISVWVLICNNANVILKDIIAVIAINLSSVFHAVKAVVPSMLNKKWGRIINTASVHGLVASKHKSAYVASKHGLVGFTKSVALELAGTVEEQIIAKAKQQNISFEKASESILEEKQPSKQFATSEQLGGLVVFLCSSAADQITGISIPVDGGWTAQ